MKVATCIVIFILAGCVTSIAEEAANTTDVQRATGTITKFLSHLHNREYEKAYTYLSPSFQNDIKKKVWMVNFAQDVFMKKAKSKPVLHHVQIIPSAYAHQSSVAEFRGYSQMKDGLFLVYEGHLSSSGSVWRIENYGHCIRETKPLPVPGQ